MRSAQRRDDRSRRRRRGDDERSGLRSRGDRGDDRSTGSVETATADDDGSLPFTGLALAGIAAAGLMLLGGGFVLRRRGRSGSLGDPWRRRS
ncbi:MAG: hypothetical protein ACRDL4_21060 [Thermoleophilaceae bacterium]